MAYFVYRDMWHAALQRRFLITALDHQSLFYFLNKLQKSQIKRRIQGRSSKPYDFLKKSLNSWVDQILFSNSLFKQLLNIMYCSSFFPCSSHQALLRRLPCCLATFFNLSSVAFTCLSWIIILDATSHEPPSWWIKRFKSVHNTHPFSLLPPLFCLLLPHHKMLNFSLLWRRLL